MILTSCDDPRDSLVDNCVQQVDRSLLVGVCGGSPPLLLHLLREADGNEQLSPERVGVPAVSEDRLQCGHRHQVVATHRRPVNPALDLEGGRVGVREGEREGEREGGGGRRGEGRRVGGREGGSSQLRLYYVLSLGMRLHLCVCGHKFTAFLEGGFLTS